METKTIKDNRAIAVFMGADYYQPNDYDLFTCTGLNDIFKDVDSDDPDAQHFFRPDQMKFDSDWSWLMPCVDKVNERGLTATDPKAFELVDEVKMNTGNVIIEDTYKSVIKFIEWHNGQCLCAKYPNSTVLPDEDGNCSLCGGDCNN